MEEQILKARNVKIHDILGLKTTRRISVKCVFPGHTDGTPSLCIYPDNSFHCFGCGENGQNAIDFVMKLGYSFKNAVDELNTY